MAFTPSDYTPVRNKSDIRWYTNGEAADEIVLNRPIDDLANMVQTVVDEGPAKKSVRLATDANVVYSSATANTILGYPGTGTFVATIVNTSTVVTTTDTSFLLPGASITGTGIPTSTTVVSITSSTQFVISNPASADGTPTLTYAQTVSLLNIDGINPLLNDRVLIKDQTNAILNGIYIVTAAGSTNTQWILTRDTDGSTWNQLASAIVATDEGSANADTVWFCTINKNAGTIGSTAITFQGLGGSGQMLGKAKVRMFSYNSQTLSENIVVPASYNGSAVGPITIADGYTLTVSDGARIVIL